MSEKKAVEKSKAMPKKKTADKTVKQENKKPKEVNKTPVKAASNEKKSEVKKQVEKKPAKKTIKKIKKPEAVQNQQTKIKKKKKLPIIRGRFGQKQFRRKSKKKWQKWRNTKGIDLLRRREDGAYPKTGYRTEKSIRGLHPSGYKEVLVHNPKELEGIGKEEAARIGATVGKKKRIEIVKKAESMEIVVLNR